MNNSSHVHLIKFLEDVANKTIILDTNVLLLLLAGLDDINTIKKVKSTKIFSNTDYKALKSIIQHFSKIMTTPHVLTEFSNLNKHAHYRKNLFNQMGTLIEKEYLEEEFIDINNIIRDCEMKFLGVTDIAIKELSKNHNYGVITTD